MRLLIVDDHAQFRGRVRAIVESASVTNLVTEAAGGDEAFEALSSREIDAIILDLSLGKENGLDLLRSMRQLHPGVPVLVLTLRKGIAYSERSLRLGAQGFLRKDCVAGELLLALHEIVAGRTYDSEKRIPDL